MNLTEALPSAHLQQNDCAEIHPLNTSDENLMLRYCNGDYSAFEVLYQRHSRGLYRYISWQSPRIDWVDEITQDSWLRLHNARATYIPKASPKTLLYQIARNRLIDIMRQQHATLACDLSNEEDSEPILEKVFNNAPDNNLPDEDLLKKELHRKIHQAINLLPHEQKETLVLHHFSELPIKDIAALTGEKPETIKGRLRYAMQKLRQIID